MSSIGRLFERNSSSIYPLLSRSGGIRPAQRKRSRLALTLSEREEVSRGIATNYSIRLIASLANRSASTISREINRNGGYYKYRAAVADQATWDRARRPKRCKLSSNRSLVRVVSTPLKQHGSPQQISGCLKRKYPDRDNHQVSHETIYRSLYIQARGALKKELLACLRSQLTIRHSKHDQRPLCP